MKGAGRLPHLFVLSALAVVAACGGGGDDDDGGTTNPPPPPPPPATATGYLFVAAGGSINAFTSAQTTNSSTAFPALSLTHSLGYSLTDLALDKNGNIWAVGVGSNTVVRFRSTNIPGAVTPDLTINSTDLNRPWGIAFDSLGNLYVSNSAGGGNGYSSIVRFNNVIGLSGNQTLSASLVIRPPTGGAIREYYSLVHGLAFAKNGDLWAGGPSTLLRFINPRNLTGTITPMPDGVIIKDGYGPQFGFSGMLAIDASGNLWATGCQGLQPCVDFVMKFSNPVFAGVVSPNPNSRVTLGNDHTANGMAFDAAGDLWMIWDLLGRAIVRIANPGSLGQTVTATPATTLNNTASGNTKLVFFPTPLGLPIY